MAGMLQGRRQRINADIAGGLFRLVFTARRRDSPPKLNAGVRVLPGPRDSFDQMEKAGATTLRERARRLHEALKDLEVEALHQRGKRIAVFIYRFALLIWDGVMRTELPRRASALTYTTILSIFPLIAVISSSASFFYTPEKEQEFMHWIEKQLLPSMEVQEHPMVMSETEAALFAQQEAVSQNIRAVFTAVSQKFRDSAAGVGVFGFIGLLVTIGVLYYSIESVVNMTWQTQHRWRWTQTLTSFITVLVFAPVVLALSLTSSTVAIMLLSPDEKAPAKIAPPLPDGPAVPAAASTAMAVAEPRPVSPFVRKIRLITTNFGFLVPYISMFLNALLLGMAYSFLPKTKVYWRYAFLGGLLAAITWQLARSLFVYYVVLSAVNRTLADALGVSVIFLLWIYITWTILLCGNLFVYTLQNFESLWAEKRTGEQMLLDVRLVVAVMLLLARRFLAQGGGYTESEIRLRIGLRQEQFGQIARRLERGGFITPLANEGYQIAHPPDQVRVRELLGIGCDLGLLPVARRGKGVVGDALRKLQEQTLQFAGDVTLADLASQTDLQQIEPVREEPAPVS